jgi:tRNA(Ile)-lysidine synthetase-like protein
VPFIVRSRVAGDRIRIHSGHKSLKSIYNEWRVPPERRHLIPVVVAAGEVQCILGHAQGFADRYRWRPSPALARGRSATVEPVAAVGAYVRCTAGETRGDRFAVEAT